MTNYKIKLKLISPALIGSGVGYGALIDADIVFDEAGIPYIPAKRVKGCLFDSARDVEEMFDTAEINFKLAIEETFGKQGTEKSAPVFFSNLTIGDYKANKKWLEYFTSEEKYQGIVSRDLVLDTFTELRQQTKIGHDGIAFDHSLRTIRVVKKDTLFIGNIQIENKNNDKQIFNTLLLSCLNFRHLGTKRNRGFGEVLCELYEGDRKLSIQNELEGICIA